MKLPARFSSIFKNLGSFDILFVAISIVLIAGIYVIFKREVVYITVRFKVTDENILYAGSSPRDEYALRFVIGDKEIDELGRVSSEIVGIESYKTDTDHTVTYLDIKLRAIYNPRKNLYTIRGKQITFGESIPFYFSNVKVTGLVMDFPGFAGYKDMKTGTTTVRAQLRWDSREFSDIYGVPSFMAYSLRPGDTVKDSKNNILAKILDVQVLPAKRTIVTSSGNSFLTNDPDLKDVYYTIELTTKTSKDRVYMFDYIPVQIGTSVPLNIKTVSVWPVITEIVNRIEF
ncbi:DUF4330 family protein [Candidatus Gottesmanbacteria bacterium]|nr:DUF4330 family protein [Candidatus Gottesmanbacteria bacterium]